MKNILVLTSEYPNPFNKYDTPVVHYFVKEWEKNGCEVRVYHYRSVFPRIYYWIAKHFSLTIKKVFKTDFIPENNLFEEQKHLHDGVNVTIVPLYKIWPHFNYSSEELRKTAIKLVNKNESEGFVPDLIVGHFANPQIQIIPFIKNFYPLAKTSIVFHEDIESLIKRFRSAIRENIHRFDRIGFRYEAARQRFLEEVQIESKSYICYSGVPESYILKSLPEKKFGSPKIKICFAGMLIPLKNVDTILVALKGAFTDNQFEFTILGDGIQRKTLEDLVIKLNIKDSVFFKGKVGREIVQKYLVESDVFIMVSAPEAFGLVYLEAMAKGCLVVGSVRQGIDGVIKDGWNGFLCEPRDQNDLINKIRKIKSLSLDDKRKIAENALETVRKLTDKKAAEIYFKNLATSSEYGLHSEYDLAFDS
jgi:glycosyltransferase involved in cell wall biosynthesis